MHGLLIACWVEFLLLALLTLAFVLVSWLEREWRALWLGVATTALVAAVFLVPLLLGFPGRTAVQVCLLLAGSLAVLVFAVPLGRKISLHVSTEQVRVDERDALFHRFYRLEPGTTEYDRYYQEHPGKKDLDDKIRALPSLGSPASRTYHALTSPYQLATFQVLESITRDLEWEPAPLEGKPVEAAPEEFASRLKGFARYLGAAQAGCTRLNPAYVYTRIGRSPGTWGESIDLDHTHAVAIAVEMSHDMVRLAPDSPTTTETAYRYFEAGKIAMVLARTINLLGYRARVHVDGNYRVMCVPVAADAGLGELGRLGLLISPVLGPRVRLAVVTTDMPLAQDPPVCFGVQPFCDICRKCAANCPSGSIDKGDKAVHAGVEKWLSQQDSCYHYWRIQGTDCSVCVKVCPFSHPGNFLHDQIRKAVRRNPAARRLLLWADDFFYGRKPRAHARFPDWHRKGERFS